MSKSKVWATSADIEYISLTRERLAEFVDLLKKHFYPNENICKAVGLADRPEAIAELEDMIIFNANAGVSVVAVDKKTGKAAGALLNLIKVKNEPLNPKMKEHLQNTKHQEILSAFKVLEQLEKGPDFFTSCNVDCLMELRCLVVSPEYSKRGIGLKLCEVSLELATQLYKGENVKTSIDNTKLPLLPRPQLVTSVFTTFKTQKMGRKLNFQILKTFSYEKLFHNGKSLTNYIGNETKEITEEYKRLV